MRAPFHLELQVVRRNAALASFVAHPLIDQLLHPLDELRSGQPAFGLDRAAKLSIDDVAHAFQHTPQQSLRQCFFALLFAVALALQS